MSGFALSAGAEADATVRRIASRLRHRGDTVRTEWIDPFHVVLLNRPGPSHFRASLWQTGRGAVLVEGFVENADELARPAGASHLGEAIWRGVEERGSSYFADLRGAYVVAVLGPGEQDLLLARDRAGLRPAYYWSAPGSVVVASEVKGVLEHPDAPRILDREVLGHLLVVGLEPSDRSLAQDVRKVEPGHPISLTLASGPEEQGVCHDFPPPTNISVRAASDRLDRALRAGLRMRLEDNPDAAGLFLSGGLDSYLVGRTLRECGPRAVVAGTAGVDDHEASEAKLARDMARRIGIDQVTVTWGADRADGGLADLLSRTVSITEQPGRFANAPLLLHLLESWSDLPGVVATGDGADCLFGDAGFLAFQRARRLRHLPGRKVLADVLYRIAEGGSSRLDNLATLLEAERFDFRLFVREVFEHSLVSALLEEDAEEALRTHYRRLGDLYSDQGTTPGQTYAILKLRGAVQGLVDKVERLVSHAGSDPLHPYLMPDVVELGFSLPDALRRDGGRPKPVIRQLAARTLPSGVLDRPKLGFGAPRTRWLREDDGLRHVVRELEGADSAVSGFVREDVVQEAAARFRMGDGRVADSMWILVSTELWCRSLGIG